VGLGGRPSVVALVAPGSGTAANAVSACGAAPRSVRRTGDSLVFPEVRVGGEAAQGRERLRILAGGQGPIVVLPVGGGAGRLGPAPALAAVDSDGQALILSGPAAPDASVRVTVRGVTRTVGADASGRWSLLIPGGGPADIRVGAEDFDYPGGAAGQGVIARRAGLGWLATWPTPGGASQSVWLPDRG